MQGSSLMEILSPGYWQEQDLELGTLAPLDEAISSTVWSSPDMLASQGENPGPSSQCPSAPHSLILTLSPTHVTFTPCSHSPHYRTTLSSHLTLEFLGLHHRLLLHLPLPPYSVQRPTFTLHIIQKIKKRFLGNECITQNKENVGRHHQGSILLKEEGAECGYG